MTTPANNGPHGGANKPEDDDPFGYLYEDGQAAGATSPLSGGGYGYPGASAGGHPGPQPGVPAPRTTRCVRSASAGTAASAAPSRNSRALATRPSTRLRRRSRRAATPFRHSRRRRSRSRAVTAVVVAVADPAGAVC